MYKSVLITGASRGIGRAIACAFAREGCRLVINCSHSEKELLALADELRETCHVDVLTSIGDVSDYTYMEQLFSQSEARFGGVDILVNNAGISHIGLLEDMTIDEWNRIIGVNLTSVFSASKLALPHMIHQKSGEMSAPPARSHTPPAKAASIPSPAPSPRSSHRAASRSTRLPAA